MIACRRLRKHKHHNPRTTRTCNSIFASPLHFQLSPLPFNYPSVKSSVRNHWGILTKGIPPPQSQGWGDSPIVGREQAAGAWFFSACTPPNRFQFIIFFHRFSCTRQSGLSVFGRSLGRTFGPLSQMSRKGHRTS